ncbi:MAG: hypothetical protein H0T71_11435 [Acidobacteria bacterium]|nr:hypothetical protein [Acidobacteriota bacterium]
MSISSQAVQFGKRRLTRKLLRAVPWLGAVLAVATIGKAIRRKGMLGGTLDSALDFIPFVGSVKNTVEIARGRDLIRDKTGATR